VRLTIRQVASTEFVRRDLRVAAPPWVVARVLVVGTLSLSRFVADKLPALQRAHAPSAGLFVYDGGWYRHIAEHGYAALPREGLRFFPLYPLLGRWLGWLFFDHTAVALVVVSNAAALLLAALLHRLVLRETGDAGAASRAAWFVAVLPPALCLVLAYAEPLMMVAAVGMFLALRSRRWLPAAVLGFAAGFTRPLGLLLIVPAAIEAARAWRGAGSGDRARCVAAVAAPAIGTAVYLAWVGAVFGDPLVPFSIQSRNDLRGGSVDPVTHVVNSISDLIHGDRFSAGLHLVWLPVFIAIVVLVARRLPSSYTAYAAATLLLAMTSTNISSFERYVFSAFPFVIGVAIATKRDDANRMIGALAAGGLVAYSLLAFYQLYVP
jgi:hypothetical protein